MCRVQHNGYVAFGLRARFASEGLVFAGGTR